MTTRSLSFHAHYRCRHRGACCTAGWPIPVEVDRLARLRAAMVAGHLRPLDPASGADPFVAPAAAPADTPVVLGVRDQRCVFYDENGKRCAIQRALDHDALPLACRQFPRVSVQDPRGVSITLSHYCPTAAGLLDAADDAGAEIVVDAPAFPAGGEYVGLDATASLPPLLRPGMLMDWESWWRWEELSVGLLMRSQEPPGVILARLSIAVEQARTWTIEDGPLIARVTAAFRAAAEALPPARIVARTEVDQTLQLIRDAIPADWQSHAMLPAARARRPDDRAAARFLAAHAFASWTAHLGKGLRSWLRSIEVVWILIEAGMDVRAIDLLIRHLADPSETAQAWSQSEDA